MPDITMCTSQNCKYKDECYRIVAKPDKLQSYANLEYECNESSGFDYFIQAKTIDKYIDI